jgi:hypothetical protein
MTQKAANQHTKLSFSQPHCASITSSIRDETVDSSPSDPRPSVQGLVKKLTHTPWHRRCGAYGNRTRRTPVERLLRAARCILPRRNDSD